MYTDVESLKKALEVNGFTSVKFPGGGGNMRQHSSIGILWDVVKSNKGNEVIALLMHPFRHIPPGERIIQSSEIGTIGETPRDTVIREVFEETGISITEQGFQQCCEIEINSNDKSIKKFSFSAKTSLDKYQNSVVITEEVELGCGTPIVVELEIAIQFLVPMIDNTSTFNKVSLRRALEKKILFTPSTINVSKRYERFLKNLPVENTITNKFLKCPTP